MYFVIPPKFIKFIQFRPMAYSIKQIQHNKNLLIFLYPYEETFKTNKIPQMLISCISLLW